MRRSWRRRSVALALVLALATGLLVSGCNTYRAFFPSRSHDREAPTLPDRLPSPAILLMTKTNGFRHHEAIGAGKALFARMAKRRGWALFHTENAAVHNERDLARFDAVVWHQTSGDILDPEQKAAFRAWLEAGGGFVGVHGAGGDGSYEWRWYVEELIGAQFIGHTMGPQFQEATAIVEDPWHPATSGLPESFVHEEEWYSFDRSVRGLPGFRVLVSVDEGTYSPRLKILLSDRDIAMGDHPVVWSHCQGRGRALFSALGHKAEAYDSEPIQKLLEGAVAWAAGLEGDGCR